MKAKLFLLIILFICPDFALGQSLEQVSTAIQIASRVSDGKLSLSEIISIARENNIQALIITDRDLMRWEYGIWPLRNILKRKVEDKSIFTYGIKRYLKDLRLLQKNNPDLILIPGVESSPFYNWEGNVLDKTLTLRGWHRHILAVGLEKYADYNYLPVTGNKKGIYCAFSLKDILLFWPVLLIWAGWAVLFGRRRYSDDYEKKFVYIQKAKGVSGILL